MNKLEDQIATELSPLQNTSEVECSFQKLEESILLLISIKANEIKKVKVNTIVPSGYPNNRITITIESFQIPVFTLSKIQRSCEEQIDKFWKSQSNQISNLITFLLHTLKRSRLVLCYEDIEFIKSQLLKDDEKLEIFDKKGLVRISTNHKDFSNIFEVNVPPDYPSSCVKLKSISSTFPYSINEIFFSQANEISRRISQNLPLGSLERPESTFKSKNQDVHLTTMDYRHDIKFLKERKSFQDNAIDKQSRRNLRRFEQSEIMRENAISHKLTTQELHEYKPQFHNSFLPPISFIFEQYIRHLPDALCGHCSKPISQDFIKTQESYLPEQNLCGHWYHFCCLKSIMTTPPFGKKCPVKECSSPVFSKYYKQSDKTLEKNWALQQAHKRNLEDLEGFLDF